MTKPEISIIWFRRDLRLHDNAALYHALKGNHPVLPVFVFDTKILNDLEDKRDRRVEFIYNALQEMQEDLQTKGSSLQVFYSTPQQAFEQLVQQYTIMHVYTNHDYEQYAIDRDAAIAHYLKQQGAGFHTFKDQVIFEKDEVVKDDGKPYTVFTPYSKKWRAALRPFYIKSYPVERYYGNFYKTKPLRIPTLEQMGFEATGEPFPGKTARKELIEQYDKTRDFPALHGTSRLGVHLRFGTISIRKLAAKALELNQTFLNELIWRDFYHAILWHFEHVRNGNSFKPEYDRIEWRYNEADFQRWCDGKTGYPIVDAGMRELNATGYMHNRVRMITASFLSKHLLIDWRWGEAYFAKKLLDYDYAANSGGWQWAAGCGCDAAPYFRVFNPTLQTEKFDKELKYIKRWVPELNSFDYPKPMVPHDVARKRALDVYGAALKK